MKKLNNAMIKKFLEKVQKTLTGRWVLSGGTLLPFLEIDYRVTTDIDFVGLTAKEQAQNLKLMEIAEELGLPVETINQAASYYLQKIDGFENELETIYKSKNLTISRPNLLLFLKLKLPRLSYSDFSDCMELLKLEKKKFKQAEIEKVILSFQKKEPNPQKLDYFKKLLEELKN